jgi:hypothetical protein
VVKTVPLQGCFHPLTFMFHTPSKTALKQRIWEMAWRVTGETKNGLPKIKEEYNQMIMKLPQQIPQWDTQESL